MWETIKLHLNGTSKYIINLVHSNAAVKNTLNLAGAKKRDSIFLWQF